MADILTPVLVDPVTGKSIPLRMVDLVGDGSAYGFAVDVTATVADQVSVQGIVAHDAVDSGNPVKVGGKAFTLASTPAAVASADRVDAAYTLKGAAYVALTDSSGGAFTFGQKAAAASVPVVLASDAVMPPLGVFNGTWAAPSKVDSLATNQTLLAANAARRGLVIYNTDANPLRIKFGATATATSFHFTLENRETLTLLNGVGYAGIIDGIWDANGSGSAFVSEIT